MPQPEANSASCKICTIHLEAICAQRVWWFRLFCGVLANCVRLYAFAAMVRTSEHKSRSPMCKSCIRFRKNILKSSSPLFNWLDGLLNPIFNHVRNGILTPEELEHARLLARRAAERDFTRPADLVTL